MVGGLYNGDGIPATTAGINYPETVTVDAAGYVLIGDRNRLIREVADFADPDIEHDPAQAAILADSVGSALMVVLGSLQVCCSVSCRAFLPQWPIPQSPSPNRT